ncbi:MAG: TonB-dependent receptor, partial [Gemmatimonadetes bacterium]|nr:TonB-dependent receptor [Gemmatimonadota bacterium]
IQWIPGASGVWRPHNVGEVLIRGAETELEAELWHRGETRVALGASGTYLDARDRTGEPNVDGRRLVYRPEWSGTGRLLLDLPLLGGIETGWQYVGDTFVTDANTKVLPAHWQGEVRWRRPLSPAVRIDAAVTNVLDARARDFRDYPLPGRSWQLGLTWSGGSR